MATKRQKSIRVQHPELFDRAKELLENELGPVTDAQIITSSLRWLIAGRSQRLVAADEMAAIMRESSAESTINAIQVLIGAGLLEPADYAVEFQPDSGASRLVRNGLPISPKAESSGAVDVEQILKNLEPKSATREKTVN